ncbi:hypothetical protein H9M94_01160 [Mycoplasma sp. Pen4]|uniref:MAG1210 family protein n=1 Tax=Mycoplasma sp. Pen4 TaxID=640330 RepID=UPI0016547F04|nr:hypothetical protein [Mycoplasma sp. Pen4]QNM93868.1 hypothetical protein H9M94_01160 [Mycoplasma sp. Pen4]
MSEKVLFDTSYELINDYKNKYKPLHIENCSNFIDELAKKAEIDLDQHRSTCKSYYKEEKKYNDAHSVEVGYMIGFIVTLVAAVLLGLFSPLVYKQLEAFIPMVVLAILLLIISFAWLLPKYLKYKKIAKGFRNVMEKIKAEAKEQLSPIFGRFGLDIKENLMQKTFPQITLDKFTNQTRINQFINVDDGNAYDYLQGIDDRTSTLYLQSGEIYSSPFIYKVSKNHIMGKKTYTGSITIFWSETVRDSEGHFKTVQRSQVLTASVTKPFPEYYKTIDLVYLNNAVPNLSFSRQASDAHLKTESQLKKLIKKRSKHFISLDEHALKNNSTFKSISGNLEFESLFNCTDRDNEAEYRMMFTPLAQRKMQEIITDRTESFGDDFTWIKQKKTNILQSDRLSEFPFLDNEFLRYLTHFDFEKLKEDFIKYQIYYFKTIYFSLAPFLSIPIYTQTKFDDEFDSTFRYVSEFEAEKIVNAAHLGTIMHPLCQTEVINKTNAIKSHNGHELVQIKSYGYRTEERVDYIMQKGGDGNIHTIPVPWIEYLPVTRTTIGSFKTNLESVADTDIKYFNGEFNDSFVDYFDDVLDTLDAKEEKPETELQTRWVDHFKFNLFSDSLYIKDDEGHI